MATYVYLGLTQADQKARYDSMRRGIKPQDRRGDEPFYTINHNDSEATKDEKRKRCAEWVKAREKELKSKIDTLAQQRTIAGTVFVAGKETVVEDGSDLDKKLSAMVAVKGSRFEVAKKKEASKKAEEK